MTELKNPMEIFKLLNKSNCRKCAEKTCLAFAAAVFKGQRRLGECPDLDADMIARYEDKIEKYPTQEDQQAVVLEKMKQKIAGMDLKQAAERVGGVYSDNRLTLKVFGKDFSIFQNGGFSSDIHINPWVVFPLGSYILNCKGIPLTGQWVPFRELKNSQSWHNFFHKQCESALKKIADTYPDLFEDLIHIFNGVKVKTAYEADISLVLHPLPKVPLLICYWKPEAELASDLNLFFDSSAADNMGIEAIYYLGAGIVRMFGKLAIRHGIA
jgi:hypothetical protein